MQHRCVFKKIPVHIIYESPPGLLSQIGGWQVIGWENFPQQRNSEQLSPQVLSPLHGRSLNFLNTKFGSISIKGGGWTLGPVRFYPSPKDRQMYFGLYSLKDGSRELAVSNFLQLNNVHATQVVGLATFHPEGLKSPLLFQDKSVIEPALLYTKSLCPWRVADLPWLDVDERNDLLKRVCVCMGWDKLNFIQHFCQQLASTMAHYHRLGCINDSLSWDNITLAAEITDFEWFTTPDLVLPDGSHYENSDLRRRKEVIYAYEIGCLLSRAIGRIDDANLVIEALQNGYSQGDYEVASEISKLLNSFTEQKKSI